jgi:hypothetical protein
MNYPYKYIFLAKLHMLYIRNCNAYFHTGALLQNNWDNWSVPVSLHPIPQNACHCNNTVTHKYAKDIHTPLTPVTRLDACVPIPVM